MNTKYNKKTLIILILVLAGVILFLIGLWVGVDRRGMFSSQTTKTSLVSTLSSKVVSSITASGRVTQVQGNTVTLNSGGDSLTIALAPKPIFFLLLLLLFHRQPALKN